MAGSTNTKMIIRVIKYIIQIIDDTIGVDENLIIKKPFTKVFGDEWWVWDESYGIFERPEEEMLIKTYNHYIKDKRIKKKMSPPRFLPYGISSLGEEEHSFKNIEHKNKFTSLLNETAKQTLKKPIQYIASKKKCNINNLRIELINSNFSVNYQIRQQNLQNILTEQYKIISRYDPGSYPGINIKYYLTPCHLGRKISIFIFKSGKIIITAAKNLKELNKGYYFINEILEKHKNEIIFEKSF